MTVYVKNKHVDLHYINVTLCLKECVRNFQKHRKRCYSHKYKHKHNTRTYAHVGAIGGDISYLPPH